MQKHGTLARPDLGWLCDATIHTFGGPKGHAT